MMTEEKRGDVWRILQAASSPSVVAVPREVQGGSVWSDVASGEPAGPPGSGPSGPRGSWRKRGGAPAPLQPGGGRASGSPQFVLRSHSSKRARRVRRIPGSAGGPVHPIRLNTLGASVITLDKTQFVVGVDLSNATCLSQLGW